MKKQIAITFDDGPNLEYTPKLLEILKERGAKATFFVLGCQIEKYPEVLKKAYAEGHEIANHTWNHPDLLETSDDDIISELKTTSTIIEQTIGERPSLFRPPMGRIDARVEKIIRDFGLEPVLWSVSSQDWAIKDVPQIVDNIVQNANDEGIILMHDTSDESLEAAALAMDILLEQDFEFVTVSELWGKNGK